MPNRGGWPNRTFSTVTGGKRGYAGPHVAKRSRWDLPRTGEISVLADLARRSAPDGRAGSSGRGGRLSPLRGDGGRQDGRAGQPPPGLGPALRARAGPAGGTWWSRAATKNCWPRAACTPGCGSSRRSGAWTTRRLDKNLQEYSFTDGTTHPSVLIGGAMWVKAGRPSSSGSTECLNRRGAQVVETLSWTR